MDNQSESKKQKGKMFLVLLSILSLLLLISVLWMGITSKRMEPYLIVLKRGEPAVATLMAALKEKGISSCSLSGLGALENPEISYYDLEGQKYIPHTFEGVFEVASLNGNVSELNGTLAPHIHIVLGGSEYQAIAGHLNEGTVGGTLEVTVIPFRKSYKREKDASTGLNLISQ